MPKCEPGCSCWRHKKHTAETRAKIAAANRRRTQTAETRAKLSAVAKGRVGEKHPMYGRKHTPQARANMSAAQRAVSHEPCLPGCACGRHSSENGRKGALALIAKHGKAIPPRFQGAEHPRWKGDDVRALAIHKRLSNRYGPASDYPCVECGARREAGAKGEDRMDWSYDGGAPDEKRDGPQRYTTDLSTELKNGLLLPRWYSPRCASHCHFLYDMENELRG